MQPNTDNPTKLEEYIKKAKDIAKELVSQGAHAVILSGSVAKGKENPNDIDLLVFGELDKIKNTEDLKKLSEKYEVSIQLFSFSDNYVNSIIEAYKKDKNMLGSYLAQKAYRISGRHHSWPLIPLLSEEEFDHFFGSWLGYEENHPYITKNFIILEGSDYVEEKRKRLRS